MRRLTGVVLVIAAMGLAIWLALGPSTEWDGVARVARFVVILGCFGVIGGAARLVFPGKAEDQQAQVTD
ncbi:hypothetical protein ABT121_13175 [Streptomyces sp. NPDC001928]|uniref:hypothetical protein n=1 Tax=Streptomyces sp. NPDC001928 TaxID=3154404 RepID=UPI00332FC657